MTKEENNKDAQEDAVNTNVTEDVNDIRNSKADDSPRKDAGTSTNVMDLEDYSDNDLVATVNPSVAKRLMARRKGKAVIRNPPVKKADVKSPSKDSVKKKSTPAGPIKRRDVAKSVGVGPSKSLSKVVPKKRKAKAVEESESDVEVNVHDIPLKKKPTTSKLATSAPEVPIDIVSFHFAASANRWKFVYQKRLALERELAQNARDCKDIMSLIEAAGIIKIVVHLNKCYEMLVKEFIVNLSEEYADKRSKELRKVFVRGKCFNFSSTVINNLLGRSDEAQLELEVSDNKVCQVITANQVRSWPLKGKLSASKLSMRSTVSTVLGRFIYVVGTKEKFDYGTYIFEQTMKHASSYSGTHVLDIFMTSADTSKSGSSASKAEVIAMLKETCKELEARKISLEKMISTLEKDGNEDFAGATGIEARDEREEGSDSEEEVEEGNTSSADCSDEESDTDNSGGSESEE
ncbi:uncharacterized protein LOC131639047 [Vicia villosa]|uniref:uncharacterized protein LOC131639047 n=1 Tax=Vicia villosa TaxID=3911 RepID=UPI00273A76F4|nr:uncharacterized protein LOC131639047 [Vicia villosa]